MTINDYGRAHRVPVCGFFVFWFQIVVEPFALLHCSVCDYTVEPRLLEPLWDHGNLFEIWIVRAIEG